MRLSFYCAALVAAGLGFITQTDAATLHQSASKNLAHEATSHTDMMKLAQVANQIS